MPQSPLSQRQIMNRIYDDLCGFTISKADNERVKKSKGSPVYGEIRHTALNKLLDYLGLTKHDIFYDLGSGVGKVILQTLLATPVDQAIGVELSLERFHDSELALKRAEDFCPGIGNRGRFLNQDLLTIDLSKATVIYTCSTAFSESFMRKVTKYLAQFSQPFRLVSLQELPDHPDFKLSKTLHLDMSWTRHAAVHVYELECSLSKNHQQKA